MTWRLHAVFAVGASIVVAIAVAWGFMLVGSPGTRRLERLDEQRLQDLQVIAREVHAMVVEADQPPSLKAQLPKTLQEIAERARSERIKLNDPETGEPYSYLAKDETTFELCTTFTKVRNSDRSVFWNHPAGKHCFRINVLDPPPFY
jgi:hypothetical protein